MFVLKYIVYIQIISGKVTNRNRNQKNNIDVSSYVLQMTSINITFSTCWYIFKCKFDIDTYQSWMDNMLANVRNYYLIVYSDETSSIHIEKYLKNPNIKLVIKPYEEFYNYKYKDQWIKNHEKNLILNPHIDWKVNMLWCEKIHFVSETITQKYFDTEYYGWCDIGYFRCRPRDLIYPLLSSWPDTEKINKLNKTKIYYAIVNNDKGQMSKLYQGIHNKNDKGLPVEPIHPRQVSIAGGFFISYKDNINWWKQMFDEKLKLYLDNDYLVKDDQMIIVDCIFSDYLKHFQLIEENDPRFDNWFLFQRYLLFK